MAQQMAVKQSRFNEESVDEINESPPPSFMYEQHEQSHRLDSTFKAESLDVGFRKGRPATEHLHRQGYIIYLVLFYAAMMCTSWTILVITSKHPIGRATYGCFDQSGSCLLDPDDLAYQNARTVQFIRNAQTLLSAVSLLTIPLTSAVCAAAVVPWLQQSGEGMSLRQIMTLSDKGWTSPYVYYRLLLPSGWKRYGSSFVALALLLHALGAALSPAINQMSIPVAIKVPRNSPTSILSVVALQELFSPYDTKYLSILRLRDALKSVNVKQVRPQIWVPRSTDCDSLEYKPIDPYALPESNQCTDGGMTYMSLTTEPEAWVSELSSGFTTGVRTKQFVPRVNTSVEVELIDELPLECNAVDAALLINYAGTSDSVDTADGNTRLADWSIKVCVPEYNHNTFNDTDDAQTLVETAYLDVYTSWIMDRRYHNKTKITMSTTTGYFELPNYNNGNLPGPLLQNFVSPDRMNRPAIKRRRSDIVLSLEKNATQNNPDLETLPNRGPLLNTIYALFGNGSMPSIYLNENATYNPGHLLPDQQAPCRDLVPLSSLVRAYSPYNGSDLDFRTQCVTNVDLAQGAQIHTFLVNFILPTQGLERVLRAAAYMSHEIWLGDDSANIWVKYDAGQDLQKPGLGYRAIIAITIAIAVFLLSLLMLAFYASFSKTWTYSLDAHALLRIGAELGPEALPFLVIRDAHHIGELDELPGWVGDVTEDNDVKERQLGMGWNGSIWKQVRPVKKDGLYLSYPNMQHRDSFQVFCLWCNTIFGLGGLRRTTAGVKAQKIRAWSEQSTRVCWEHIVQKIGSRSDRIVQKIGPRLRQTKAGKWWNGDDLDHPSSKEGRPAYKSVAQNSAL